MKQHGESGDMRQMRWKGRARHVRILLEAGVLFLLLLLAFPAAVGAAQPELEGFEDLNGKTVGMLTGAPFEELIRNKAPDVKQVQYFSSIPDMQMALEGKKIDAYLMNNAVAELALSNDDRLAMFPHSLGDTVFGFAMKKGSAEVSDWQEACAHISEETKQELWKKWTGADDSIKNIPEQNWPGEAGTIHVAAGDTLPPSSYRGEGGELIGFDIEMILLMAKELDVHVVFDGMEFASVMPSVESGKAMLGCGSIVVNDERREVVDFVEYYPASFVLLVRAADESAGTGNGIAGSFYRTFIKDARYKMVLSGLGLTLVTTVFSGILGLLVAFGLVFLRRRNHRVSNRLIALYSSLIAGIPAVVILMVLYFVVFGAVHISAVFVAIIGFSLIFGARAYGVIWNAVGAVDEGQQEAALALGYSPQQAFREIILPQARRIYMPLLQTQLVTLLKETSIAGYITVLELTRVGDLIRSRTMEAFFPLISIALIYYLLTWILSKLISRYELHFKNARKARRIKGVD